MLEKMRIIIMKKLLNKVSSVKLKEIFLKVDKEDVVNFCIDHLNEEERFGTTALIIGYEEENINSSPLRNESYIKEKYEYYLDLAIKNYEHELSERYAIDVEHGFPFGYGEFLSLIDIGENILETRKFFEFEDSDEQYKLELFLDSRVLKCTIRRYSDVEIVGRFILQTIFTEEYLKFI